MKKNDIILAGVGGQGILSVASIIGYAAVERGLYLKQAETHGMSQRGGDVQSHLRISENPIWADLIPMGRADIILSGEPMESLRYLPYLAPDGYIVTSMTPIKNIPDYPEMESLAESIAQIPRHIALDADNIARKAGNVRAANVVMLGAASHLLMLDYESLERGIEALFSSKGADLVEVNLKALKMGRELAQIPEHV